MVARRGPAVIREQVDFGTAELIPESDRPTAWTLLVDGTAQSYVDLSDPRFLEFEYVRRLASVVDLTGEPGAPVQVLHLGGGGLTLPRYVAATRPGSAQRVVERDGALVALVRKALPLPRGSNVRVRVADAREVVAKTRPGRYDLVVTDAFVGGRIPASLGTAEFARLVAKVLRPGGRYAMNLVDGPPLAYSKSLVAAVRTAFPEVCLLAEPPVLRRRRYGNLVLVASTVDGGLPVAELASSALRDAFAARLLYGPALDRFVAGAAPVADGAARESPEPPAGLFTR
jgi:spermidine synthase